MLVNESASIECNGARLTALDAADAHFNRGNSLAYAGQYDAALEAYDAALESNPNMEDALFNRAIAGRYPAGAPRGGARAGGEPSRAGPAGR